MKKLMERLKGIPKLIKSQFSYLDIAFSIVLSTVFSICDAYIKNHKFFVGIEPLKILSLFVQILVLFVSLKVLISWIRNGKTKESKTLSWFGRHELIKYSLIIFALWLPFLVLLYPGSFFSDTFGQISAFGVWLHGAVISAHQPVLDSAALSSIYLLSRIIGYNIASFIYVLAQAAITAATYSYFLIYLKKHFKINQRIIRAFVVMLAFPIYPFMVQTIGKDSLNGWIFVLFITFIIEIIRTRAECIKGKWLKTFILTTLLAMYTKNIQVYVVIFTLLILIFIYRNRAKILAVLFASACAVNFLIVPFVYSHVNIVPTGKQEMLSIPMQQISSVIIENPELIDDEDKENLDTILGGLDTVKNRYNPMNADPIKGYEPRAVDGEYSKFMKLWVKYGLKSPKLYVKAFAAMGSGWLSITELKPATSNYNTGQNTILHLFKDEDLVRHHPFDKTASVAISIYDFIAHVPIIGLIFTYGFYSLLIIVFVVYLLLQSKTSRRYLVVMIPIVLNILGGCFLAPVSIHIEGVRYLYPVVYTVPLLVALIAAMPGKTKKIPML